MSACGSLSARQGAHPVSQWMRKKGEINHRINLCAGGKNTQNADGEMPPSQRDDRRQKQLASRSAKGVLILPPTSQCVVMNLCLRPELDVG